jgi:hypothetical protein
MRVRTMFVVFIILLVSRALSKSPGAWARGRAGGAQQTEPVKAPSELPIPMVKEPGSMKTSEVLALLNQVRLSEFHVNDLLTDVHLERWKMPEVMRSSVGNSVTELRSQMNAMDAWREEMEKRPASAYLVFETYQGLSALPPRLDALARLVSENETPSFGAEYSAAGNRFLDAAQTLGLYLGYLLRNQDQIVSAMEGNLSSCQSELGEAMRGRVPKATPMRNARPIRPARRAPRAKGAATPGKKPGAPQK